MTNSLRALVFDFDGTIAETERNGHRVAYNSAFRELRLDWFWDESLYGHLLSVAGGKERLRFFIDRYGPLVPAGTHEATLIEAIYAAKSCHFRTIAPTVPLRPGVQRLVSEAHAAGLRIAIATTGSEAGVRSLLHGNAAVAPMFEIIAGSESVPRKKPDPAVYRWVLERLELPAESCLAIEDSSVGLRAAVAAGLPTVVTVSDYTAHDDFQSAASVLTQLGDDASPAKTLAGFRLEAGIADVAFLRNVHRRWLESGPSQH